MKLLIRAPFTECERKRLESYFDEIVYDPWTRTGERYYEDEMLDALRKEQPDALIT
ncbi:3-phosphoglycerate dehydrogenase, partial [Klebsiella oxytoca]